MTRISVFAVLTVLAAGSALAAAPSSEVMVDSAGYSQVAVPYSDLDLSRPDDAQALLSRLHSAARKVCSRTFSESDMSTRALYRSCEKQALDHAVSAVNSPRLAQAYGAPQTTVADAVSRLVMK